MTRAPASADDLGLFGPGSVTWRIHDEPILLLGGLRSLFLQALHPRALAGVMQNSDYRSDPWGRLLRTSAFVGTTIFGTTAQADAAGRRVRALHAQLRASDPRSGEQFRIDEPELLRWVHVAEVESFVTTARRAGVRLTEADVDTYHTEQRRVAALVGLDPATVPGTAAEVEAYYDDVRPELAMSRDAAEILVFLFAPPMPWGLGFTPVRAAYTTVALTAFALLPSWARRLYGVPRFPVADLTASLSVRALRVAVNAIPRRLYESPTYRAAMTRAAGHR
ncbi:MAG TPA: oxygenase MpaB family protein [Pilimelia sp.]|nr:oxygenase MpaB family protein [Pilimelia sp.]